MAWAVRISVKAEKSIKRLPLAVQKALALLMQDIQDGGPVRGDWPNDSKLGSSQHHCHIKRGRPTYVAVWEERAGQVRLIEVTYAGTHEKAPY